MIVYFRFIWHKTFEFMLKIPRNSFTGPLYWICNIDALFAIRFLLFIFHLVKLHIFMVIHILSDCLFDLFYLLKTWRFKWTKIHNTILATGIIFTCLFVLKTGRALANPPRLPVDFQKQKVHIVVSQCVSSLDRLKVDSITISYFTWTGKIAKRAKFRHEN